MCLFGMGKALMYRKETKQKAESRSKLVGVCHAFNNPIWQS